MTERSRGRRSGILMPLFSCRARRLGYWRHQRSGAMTAGCGGRAARDAAPAHQRNGAGQRRHSRHRAMAIDPIFIDVAAVPEFAAIGGEASLSLDDRARLDRRRSPSIDYGVVRQLKRQALRSAYERFVDWNGIARRGRATVRKISWPTGLVDRRILAVSRRPCGAGRASLDGVAGRPPLSRARGSSRRTSGSRQPCPIPSVRAVDRTHAVATGARADAWRGAVRRPAVHGGRRQRRRLSAPASVSSRRLRCARRPTRSAPPGRTGECPYRWDVIAQADFGWLRDRARHHRDLYDGYRIDHLVGFYRTYGWPQDGARAFFTPDNETDQLVLGERVISIFRDSGAEVIAEDLGVVPDFVRESLARLGVPGFEVFRWRRWHWRSTVYRSVGVSAGRQSRPRARMIQGRLPSGGSRRPAHGGGGARRSRRRACRAGRRRSEHSGVQPGGSRRVARSSSNPVRILCCFRFRMCLAGWIA